MSGLFSNVSGYLGLRFNSGRDAGYMPGGCCCNNSIWGGNFGSMMPYTGSFGMFNPIGFNNFGGSNFGSMFMPQFGGFNPFGNFSQFGGSFGTYGSQFGGYAQFGGSSYGNNGFGNLLGYLGAGLLGYTLGKQKADNTEATTEKSQTAASNQQSSNASATTQANGQAETKNTNTKVTNSTPNNAAANSTKQTSGNENSSNDEIISSVPKTETKPEVKAPLSGNNEVINSVKNTANSTVTTQPNKEPIAKKEIRSKEQIEAEDNAKIEKHYRDKAKEYGIDVSKEKNIEKIKALVNASTAKATINKMDSENASKTNRQIATDLLVARPRVTRKVEVTKTKSNETYVSMVNSQVIPPVKVTGMGTEVTTGIDVLTEIPFVSVKSKDNTTVLYKFKKGGKAEWDKTFLSEKITVNPDGSGKIERLNNEDGHDISHTTFKYDSKKDLVEQTIAYEMNKTKEIYTEPNDEGSFNKKTVTDAKGTTLYKWDATKKDYVKQ